MPRERHIGCVPIEVRRREHIGAIHRRALGFVHGRRIAMIEMLVELGVDRHSRIRRPVQLHLQHPALDPLDSTQGSVFDPERLLVPPEPNPVMHRKFSSALLSGDLLRLAELSALCPQRPHRRVQLAHIVPRIREHELRGVGLRFGIPRPAREESTSRSSNDRRNLLDVDIALRSPCSAQARSGHPWPLVRRMRRTPRDGDH
jgi:hypothetical protein